MKVYLAGENGKKKILRLYDSLSCRRNIRKPKPILQDAEQSRAEQSRAEQSRAEQRRAEQSRARLYLSGNDGYHKNDDFLKETEAKMRLYLAGQGYHKNDDFLKETVKKITNYEDINILESFYNLRDNEDFMELLTKCNSFLLDSGAFTFLKGSHKKKIDWDEYTEEYAAMINRHDIKLFFELDIDPLVGLKETERLRKKLETLTNKQTIPVWHISRGKEYFIKMTKEYSYVSLGGIALKEIPLNKYEKAFPWFINTAHKNGAKIHGLGYTRVLGLRQYHFDSVDSTAWLYGNRGGYIYRFHPDTGVMEQIDKKEGERVIPRMAALHNFLEWVKFGKYAQKYY